MSDISQRCVLLRGVNWIGDSVMMLPALRALRKALRCRLSLLVKPWVSSIFDNNPDVDELILYNERYKGLIGRWRLSRLLGSKGFSIAVLFQNAFDAAVISYLAGIPERVGYNRDGRGFLLTKPIPFRGEDRKMHHISYYLELLRSWGIPAEYSQPWIYLTLNERLKARQTLKDMVRPIVGINPGATYGFTKRWHTERFTEVAKMVIEELNGSIIIFGRDSEKVIADEIIGGLQNPTKEKVMSMAGKTSLRELISLISEVDVFVSNDSGPMHIAYAVGTPLIAIFGSTDPALTGPPPDGNIILKKEIKCSPCFERECKEERLICMDAITVDEVFNAIRQLTPSNPAVFFDRDGTLCKDVNYLRRGEDFEVSPDIDEVVKLKAKGFKLIGISNQSGIARGIVDEGFVNEVNEVFIEKYGFDGFYYCPHHPDEHCPCRKPEPEMALRARLRHFIDLKGSYVVGDKETDIGLARSIGAKAVLIHKEDEGLANADFITGSLKSAVEWIIQNKERHDEL